MTKFEKIALSILTVGCVFFVSAQFFLIKQSKTEDNFEIAGASITSLTRTMTGSTSMAIINANFSALNSDKLEHTDLSGGEGVTYNSGAISFDCSEVEGNGINCSGEDITLDATGDWTGTLDSIEGAAFLTEAEWFGTSSASHLSFTESQISDFQDYILVGTSSIASITSLPSLSLANDSVSTSTLQEIDTASDGECLSYDGATGQLEWVTCGSGGGVTIAQVYDVVGATTTLPNLTTIGDVGCTDCLNATEIEDIYVLTAGDTMTGNLVLDDGNTDSPALVLTDQGNSSARLVRTSGNGLTITESGQVNFKVSGDTDDYLFVFTSSNIPTIGVVGGGGLKFETYSKTINFQDSPITTTGNISFSQASGTQATLNDLFLTNLYGYFGSDCGAGNYVYGINYDGSLDCRADEGSAESVYPDFLSQIGDVSTTSIAVNDILYYTGSGWAVTATSSWDTDTDTQLTDEQVQDKVGAMVSGNTETNITVTYQDGDGTLDFTISDFLAASLFFATTTHAKITSIPNLTITESQISDFGTYTTYPAVYSILSATTSLPNLTITESQISDLGTYLATADIDTYSELNTIVADQTLAYSGGAFHDGFSDFVANEHIDWTADQGATNIHSGNYTDTNTNASTICSGGTTYLDGEGNCDDISGVYVQAADWTTIDNYPSGCGMTGGVLNAIGDTLTCVATSTWDTNTTYTAGDHLTLTGTDFDVDAELKTDTKCIYFEDPTADDDFKSIWANKTAGDYTITEIWAESDQTVNFDLQIDDGSPADVNGTDISPAAGEAEDTSLSGDTTLAAGEELDLAITSVSGTPTWVSICWTYTKND